MTIPFHINKHRNVNIRMRPIERIQYLPESCIQIERVVPGLFGKEHFRVLINTFHNADFKV